MYWTSDRNKKWALPPNVYIVIHGQILLNLISFSEKTTNGKVMNSMGEGISIIACNSNSGKTARDNFIENPTLPVTK